MKATVLAVTLGLWAHQAGAHLKSGSELMEMLRNPNNAQAYAQGVGYVQGVADGSNSILFCLPEGVTTRQVIDLVWRELADAAAVRHLNASMTVTAALSAAFPCQKVR